MQVIGITGAIAMGKSSVAGYLSDLGIPVHDADACVHKIFDSDIQVFQQIKQLFPTAIVNGSINRKILSQLVFPSPEKMRQLESIVHPKVRQSHIDFINKHKQSGSQLVVLDIPLLFEQSYQELCDSVIVVACSKENQQSRAMEKRGISLERLKQINDLQMPIEDKLERADFIVYTDKSKQETRQFVDQLIGNILNKDKQCAK